MKKLLNAIIEKDEKGNLQLSKSGITLIALVITIVVLIILAAVVIGLTLGQNGLLNRTKQAKEDYLVKANEEQVELANAGTLNSSRDTAATLGPTGTIISYYGNTAPEGYLACDGTEYNISDYTALAELINTTTGSYGTETSGKFKVPDLQGEFLRGAGQNRHINNITGINDGSGANVGEHQSSTSLPIFGNYQNRTIYIDTFASSENDGGVGNYDTYAYRTGTRYYKDVGIQSSNNSSRAVQTTRPTNTSVLYCIKY